MDDNTVHNLRIRLAEVRKITRRLDKLLLAGERLPTMETIVLVEQARAIRNIAGQGGT